MKFGVGALFVVLGLLILWLAVTGRLSNVEGAWRALTGQDGATASPAVNPNAGKVPNPLGTMAERLNVSTTFPGLPTLGRGSEQGLLA
jgi:hypothetical protein